MNVVPRWLRARFGHKLSALDQDLAARRWSGLIVVELHYKEGVPLTGKVREAALLWDFGPLAASSS